MIHPETRIMIAGDSWGCGEWDNSTPYVRPHLGIEQYFREYRCNVMNLSIGGSNNEHSANSILLIAPTLRPHLIFWIQTDPFRSFDINTEFPQRYEDLCSYQRSHLSNIYARLNSLGQPIQCIGGCSKLDMDLIADYTNLVPIIPSIIEFFDCIAPVCWTSIKFVNSIGSDISLAALDMLLENTVDPLKILDQKWFFPDGGHPNRAAHLKIFEYLVQHVDSPKI